MAEDRDMSEPQTIELRRYPSRKLYNKNSSSYVRLPEVAEMVRRGCTVAHVESYTFQAPGFYEQLGYEQVFANLDTPPGHADVLLRKRLR